MEQPGDKKGQQQEEKIIRKGGKKGKYKKEKGLKKENYIRQIQKRAAAALIKGRDALFYLSKNRAASLITWSGGGGRGGSSSTNETRVEYTPL